MKIASFIMMMGLFYGLVAQEESDFQSLFDGKTLEGWTATEENPESFFVDDGTIICKGGRAHLFYTGPVADASFKNFELQLKVRTTMGSNSGVYFHTAYQKEGWPAAGFEAQVNSTHTDPRKTGSLYGITNIWAPGDAEDPFVVRVDEKQEVFVYREKAPSADGVWFDYQIRVLDGAVTIKVDGITTVQWTQPEG
ncbi:MAG: DUF1080 domain-containing protein, partial [Saprospiraceae bacterium]|nr:DUF1080 domain-containing protein [Saprospiraceae bacterium]